jgi:predicted dehydrogenase
MKPFSVGLIGIGGYGASHLSTLASLQAAGVCELKAIADPFAPHHPDTVAALKTQSVAIYDDAEKLCARDDIEAVFIATPIALHAPQALMALEAGKHVYLEKPPCVTLAEHDALSAALERAQTVCAVGFQQQTGGAVRFVKSELVRGALGKVDTIWASVRWRRADAYYQRASWAGKWRMEQQPVFDGPATNALSHVVQAALFLAGESHNDAAQLRRVRGALKKARPIESYDSIYLEAQTTAGVLVRLALTHATIEHDAVTIRCAGENGIYSLGWNGEARFEPRLASSREYSQGNHDTPIEYAFPGAPHLTSVMDFFHAIRQPERRPITTLENTRSYLQMTNGALQSSGDATNFNAAKVSKNDDEAGGVFTVDGLDAQFAAFAQNGTASPSLLAPGDWMDIENIATDLAV